MVLMIFSWLVSQTFRSFSNSLVRVSSWENISSDISLSISYVAFKSFVNSNYSSNTVSSILFPIFTPISSRPYASPATSRLAISSTARSYSVNSCSLSSCTAYSSSNSV